MVAGLDHTWELNPPLKSENLADIILRVDMWYGRGGLAFESEYW